MLDHGDLLFALFLGAFSLFGTLGLPALAFEPRFDSVVVSLVFLLCLLDGVEQAVKQVVLSLFIQFGLQ